MAEYTFPNLPPTGSKLLVGDVIKFVYRGYVEGFTFTYLPITRCRIECWGAMGGTTGYGGYAYGDIDFTTQPRTRSLIFVVGQKGISPGDGARYNSITFGGGGANDGSGPSAGGASDVRTYYEPLITSQYYEARKTGPRGDVDKGTLHWRSLASRIIVAGGGGGRDTGGARRGTGRYGGGFTGGGGSGDGGNGKQTFSDGMGSLESGKTGPGIFGCGGSNWQASGGGGGGFYGGSTGNGGGGGSSYISGNPNCPYLTSSRIKFYNSGTTAGVNKSDGLIKITLHAEVIIGNKENPFPGGTGNPVNPGGPIDKQNPLIPYKARMKYISDSSPSTIEDIILYTPAGVPNYKDRFKPRIRVKRDGDSAELFVPLTPDRSKSYGKFVVEKDNITYYLLKPPIYT